MLCYQDKWFCQFYLECKKGSECNRAFTSIVEIKAKKWSKSFGTDDLLVCLNEEKMECFEEKI